MSDVMPDDHKLKAWKLAIKNFTPDEFDSPDAPGSGLEHMNLEFVKVLDKIRTDCNFPFLITSGYRTPEHNEKVSRVEKSEHITGNAADIAASDGNQRFKLITIALKHGIKRIGFAKGFIHIGFSYDMPQDVMWPY